MNNLLCINSPFTKPYLNTAIEEYLLKNFQDDIFMLYINEPSVIVGKHQNTLSEINTEKIIQEKIPVIRRLSGGGTVYHDLGNLNFAWIVQTDKNKAVNFDKYINDIYLFLKSLNINVLKTKNNDLSISGKKISGNAEHIFKNRLIHHGTLLYNSNLENLNHTIDGKTVQYSSKAVQSKRAIVDNIINFMSKPVSIDAFRSALFHYIKNKHIQSIDYKLDTKIIKQAKLLADKKYNTWEWNFAYSPKYIFEKKIELKTDTLNIHFQVEKGIISDLKIKCKRLNKNELNNFINKITGIKHHWQELTKIQKQDTFKQFKDKTELDDFNKLFF